MEERLTNKILLPVNIFRVIEKTGGDIYNVYICTYRHVYTDVIHTYASYIHVYTYKHAHTYAYLCIYAYQHIHGTLTKFLFKNEKFQISETIQPFYPRYAIEFYALH